MRVLRYTLRRLLFVVPVLAAALFLTFALTRIVPGNPIDRVAGPYISNEQRAALKHQAYLDRPFYTQFALYVRDIVHGRDIKNREALMNPEALEQYRDREELRT